MILICIAHTSIESYYPIDTPFPVEYESVEVLRRDFDAFTAQYAIDKAAFDEELAKWYVLLNEVKSAPEYLALISEGGRLAKYINTRNSNVPKTKRDDTFWIDLQKASDRLEAIGREKEQLMEGLPPYPISPNSVFESGHRSLVADDYSERTYTFYTLDEWLKINL